MLNGFEQAANNLRGKKLKKQLENSELNNSLVGAELRIHPN